MKLAHNIVMSVFCIDANSEPSLESVFHSLLPVDFEKEKITFIKRNAQGFQEKNIRILELIISKERHINEFLANLLKLMDNDQKNLMIRQFDSRLDSDLNFYLRIDKDKILENKFWITDSGSCFHIKLALAAFPKKKETAFALVKEIFK